MSDPGSLRRKIAEEEARLARIEKDREETLARLQELKGRLIEDFSAPADNRHPQPSSSVACRPGDSLSSECLTISERIRSASEIPFEVDLVEKRPRSAKDPRRK